ncbi:hypothetical protein NMG60_11006048 [Bertholletia excelsa]
MSVAATVVGAAVLLARLKQKSEKRWRKTHRILRKFARECATPSSTLWHLANDLASDMQASLASSDNEIKLSMLVSYVAPLPTGDEQGLYYGVNLRGENCLIFRGRLGGRSEPIKDIIREEISYPSDVMAGTSKELFDFVALQLARFISTFSEGTEEETPTARKKLGVTVSYPVHQLASSSDTPIKWKNLAFDDKVEQVGKDLVEEMNQALEKHGVDLRVFALVDSAIGDLAGGRYYNKETVAAISLGMGTTVAYVETAQAVPSINTGREVVSLRVINMEWGRFFPSHLPVTEFDASLDAASSNPNSQIFEKLISGMYLGEIVRRVLLKMAKETALFGESVPPKLAIPYSLSSPDMAVMHQDTSEDHEVVDEKLREIFGVTGTTSMVREVVAEVCDVVVERGARLAGASVVAIIKKLGRIANKKSVVVVEGGLYEHYRIFRNYLNSSVWEMLGSDLSDNVMIEHSHGSSGAGTLFLAASQTQSADS